MTMQRDSGLDALQNGDLNGAIPLLEEACLLAMRFWKKIGGQMCERRASKYLFRFTMTIVAFGWFGVISVTAAILFA